MFEKYKQYSLFKNLQDFNNHFEQNMVDYKNQFSKGERVALRRLVRYSAKVAGVCYAKIQTIVAATHEHDGIGISRSTFERMLRKAKSLGLIEVVNTYKRGKQSHNIYIFKPYESKQEEPVVENEVPCTIDVPNKPVISKSNKKLLSDIRIESADPFYNHAQYFFDDETINRLKEITLVHTRINLLQPNHSIDASLESLKVLVAKMKRKRISSPEGFYNGIISKIAKRIRVTNLFEEAWVN